MTTFSNEEIEKELSTLESFCVATIQSKFGLGYEKARAFVDKLVREKKAVSLEDGLSYVYETPLKKAQEEKKAHTPFGRFFGKREPLSADKIAQAELEILTALYNGFNIEIEAGAEPHSYTLEVTTVTEKSHTLYLDYFENTFRIHDNHSITDAYEKDLVLSSPLGEVFMSRVMSGFNSLMTSKDGCIGGENITKHNAPNVLSQLIELLELMEDIGDYPDAMYERALDDLDRAMKNALSYLILKANSRKLDEVLELARRELNEDELDSTEQEGACRALIEHMGEMSEYGFSSLSAMILNPRVKKYRYVARK